MSADPIEHRRDNYIQQKSLQACLFRTFFMGNSFIFIPRLISQFGNAKENEKSWGYSTSVLPVFENFFIFWRKLKLNPPTWNNEIHWGWKTVPQWMSPNVPYDPALLFSLSSFLFPHMVFEAFFRVMIFAFCHATIGQSRSCYISLSLSLISALHSWLIGSTSH